MLGLSTVGGMEVVPPGLPPAALFPPLAEPPVEAVPPLPPAAEPPAAEPPDAAPPDPESPPEALPPAAFAPPDVPPAPNAVAPPLPPAPETPPPPLFEQAGRSMAPREMPARSIRAFMYYLSAFRGHSRRFQHRYYRANPQDPLTGRWRIERLSFGVRFNEEPSACEGRGAPRQAQAPQRSAVLQTARCCCRICFAQSE